MARWHNALGVERAVALAVALATLVPALIVFALGDADDVLFRSAIPPLVLIVAVVAPRWVTLAVAACGATVTAYAAAVDPSDRGVLIGSAVADLVIVGAQLAAGHFLAPRRPEPVGADPAGTRTTAARRAAGAQIRSLLPAPAPTSRPAEWSRLSPRQAAVLDLAIEGQTAKAIAERLEISKRTVETHVAAGYAKLGAADRKDLLSMCRAVDDR